ncbi:MAG: branched-chain amino acid ABC transporter permease [Nitrospirae bacterium]|nr:branched-chain amino acid ABC transporter permease [Nitrospirota bacterium]
MNYEAIKKHPVLKALLISLFAAILFLPFKDIKSSTILFAIMFIFLSAVLLIKKSQVLPALPKIRWTPPHFLRAASVPSVIMVFILLPFFLKDYYLDVLIMSGIYMLLALGLNIIVGFTGLLNLGFAAFYAIGAYTYAIANTKLGLDFWTSIPLSAGIAALSGIALAIPALRLRGDYLAIVTLGFGEIVRLVLNNWDSLTNGPNGITGIARPSLFGASLDKLNTYYYLVFIFVVIAVIIIRRVECSRIGRAWISIKENEIAASSLGINTTKYKLYAFGFGTVWAGIAGILFASKMQFVSPESFTFMESVLILSMVIVGGLGNTFGAIAGAFILVLLPELLREVQSYRMLILGIALVLFMLFRPQGILGGFKSVHFRR